MVLSHRLQVGITLNGTFIESLDMGGSAFVSGELYQGDEVLKIDEADVSYENISERLIGSDVAGTIVTLLVRRASRHVSPL